jgi:hypothetical protein
MLQVKTIEIRRGFTGSQSHVQAACFGDWAAHRHLDDPSIFVLTLMPLGLNMPPDWCSFRTELQAVSAMTEISRLKNSWAVVTQADLTKPLKAELQRIAKRHGAVEGPIGMAVKADRDRFGRQIDRRPNGYSAP